MRWKTVRVNTKYEVSNTGIVRRRADDFVLGKWKNNQGYELVRLSRPRKVYRVHRLVAQAFVANPKKLPFINHLDCVRNHNNAENLEWCTQWENLQHSANLGRMQRDYWKGKRSPSAKLSNTTANAIRQAYAKGGLSWEVLAKRFGTNKRTVGHIVRSESYV